MFVICTMLYWMALPFVLGIVIVYSTVSIITRPFDKNNRFFDPLYRHWPPLALWLLRVRVVAHGLEHLNGTTGYVYVSNHASYLDIPVLSVALPGNLRFVYRHELIRVPIWGWALHTSPFIDVRRDDPRSAIGSIKQCVSEIARGASVVIYPEGTRSKDGSLGEFKRGGFLLATKTGAPIVPVAIRGAHELFPPGRFSIRPGTVDVFIGAPILPEKPREGEPSVEQKVRAQIEAMLAG